MTYSNDNQKKELRLHREELNREQIGTIYNKTHI
jgi:hypothetical protein